MNKAGRKLKPRPFGLSRRRAQLYDLEQLGRMSEDARAFLLKRADEVKISDESRRAARKRIEARNLETHAARSRRSSFDGLLHQRIEEIMLRMCPWYEPKTSGSLEAVKKQPLMESSSPVDEDGARVARMMSLSRRIA